MSFVVPRLNEVEEGGVLDHPPSVCPSVRTGLVSVISLEVHALTGPA